MIKIKIKDFAKIPFSQSFDENSVDQSENVAVAIVSASGSAASHPADDEHKPMRKPRSKIQRSPRKSRFSVNGKYHKISEYFSIAKKDCKFILNFLKSMKIQMHFGFQIRFRRFRPTRN